jgi:uncharacterized C2H2 Zn-finger protein
MEFFVCDRCRRTFTSSQDLDRHVAATHPAADGDPEQLAAAGHRRSRHALSPR